MAKQPSRRTSGASSRDAQAAEQTKSATALRYLKTFREIDASHGGSLSPAALKIALEAEGVQLVDGEFKRFLAEVNADENTHMSFPEFCEAAKKYNANHLKLKSKLARIPRAYFDAKSFDESVETFRGHVGSAGELDKSDLHNLLSKYSVTVSPERLQAILAEAQLDDDRATYGETEFLVILAKALNLKKRKIGSGQHDLKELKEEGFSNVELKRVGYEYKDFIASGYKLEDLLPIFPAVELSRAGVPLSDMVANGWDCARGRDLGYGVAEMVQAGCSVRQMREAGHTDLAAATLCRTCGISAAKMKAAGWKLSELMKAEYSLVDLRLAGFSMVALNAMQQMLPNIPVDKENFDRQVSCVSNAPAAGNFSRQTSAQ